jgi:5-methylcytosine-specific restriction endonuclease McrA
MMASWEETKRQVWTRDQGVCQGCGKSLMVIQNVSKELRAAHTALKLIPIYRWEVQCYSCKKPTPIVTYYFLLDYHYSIGDIPKLDELLRVDNPWVKSEFSVTQGIPVICNTCVHLQCGKIAMGNYYVRGALTEFETTGNLEALRVGELPNITMPADFPELQQDHTIVHRSREGLIHYLNASHDDKRLDNLLLLCKQCHIAWPHHPNNS